MPKRTQQQEIKRLLNSGYAGISERKRIIAGIAENKELQDELVNLRKHYKIGNLTQVDWLKAQPHESLVSFTNDIGKIKEKYCISEKMNNAFWDSIWNLPKSRFVVGAAFGGMPEIDFSKETGMVLLITPETDIRNELVIKFIEEWQRETLNKHNTPPQPQRIEGSRRLDWRPVWEWSLRHPQITRKEIAKMLKRNYTEVKRKLEELDKGIDYPPFLYSQK